MSFFKQNILLFLMFLGIVLSSCDKRWDEHTEVKDANFNSQLLDKMKENPDLSKFVEYLETTHYADTLKSAKAYTVWAPTNQALQALDPTVINTDAKLKLFVANHIANLSFLTSSIKQSFIRVKTLNGKSVTFSAATVDGSPIVSKDLYLGNGVLHVISTAITPKPSIWEYVMSTNTLQKQELLSLNVTLYDFNKTESLGIDPLTGKKIPKPGTGFYTINRFLNRELEGRSITRSADITKEDSTFTYILLTDAAFNAEKTKLEKYYKTSAQDTTDSLTKFAVIKDLAFKGLLDKDNFPASVLSVGDSVTFHLDKNAVVETRNVSNGVVYVMSSLNYDLGDGTFNKYAKLKPIIIEGESVNNTVNTTDGSLSSVKATAGSFEKRLRRNPDGSTYTFLYRFNHATATNWTRYRPNEVNSVKYKVYWRVPKDFNLEPAAKASVGGTTSKLVFSPMRFAIGDPAVVTPGFPYVTQPGALPDMDPVTNQQKIDPISGKYLYKADYSEQYLGEFTAARYYSNTLKLGVKSTLSVYHVGSTATTAPDNDMFLDYIKLVPIP